MTASHFCLSVTLLDAAYHGRRDDGVPEWPPSPLRAFQALRAAAAARDRGADPASDAVAAFLWLESLDPPEIVAPAGREAPRPYRLYVPNNHGDLVVKAWAGGNADASLAEHRTAKDVRPTRLVGGDALAGGTTVRFLWRLSGPPSADVAAFAARLADAARSVTHLGWGVDMAAGHAGLIDEPAAAALADESGTERWTPGGGTPLRTPQAETADGASTTRSLDARHAAFVRRMAGGVPRDVPPLAADQFRVVGYGRATDPPVRPAAAFLLLKPDASGKRAFDAPRRAAAVAGMVRNAVARAAGAAGWGDERVREFVHGHGENGGAARGEGAGRRFGYLPLPSLEQRGPKEGPKLEHVGAIRRVLVVAPPDAAREVAWVRSALSGAEMIDEATGDPAALLSLIPNDDRNLRDYVGASAVWSTVTPVLLPGYDDGGAGKAVRLVRKAFAQAGLPPELVRDAEIECRRAAFRSGVDLASRYLPPKELEHWPRRHVRVRWRDAAGRDVKVGGPLAIGAGRHRGLGVFAAE